MHDLNLISSCSLFDLEETTDVLSLLTGEMEMIIPSQYHRIIDKTSLIFMKVPCEIQWTTRMYSLLSFSGKTIIIAKSQRFPRKRLFLFYFHLQRSYKSIF